MARALAADPRVLLMDEPLSALDPIVRATLQDELIELQGIIGDQFSRRGIACLVIDTPGTGEPLRLRGVPSQQDYEVPTATIVMAFLLRC